MGHSRRFDPATLTSGLPPETDIVRTGQHVSNLPTAEVNAAYSITSSASEQRG
jgi:hypothetical protein